MNSKHTIRKLLQHFFFFLTAVTLDQRAFKKNLFPNLILNFENLQNKLHLLIFQLKRNIISIVFEKLCENILFCILLYP